MKTRLIAAAFLVALVTASARAEVLINAHWTDTDQVNVTPFDGINNIVVGVNFVNNSISSPGDSTLLGIGFDDVNVHPGTGETYDFTNNAGGGSFDLTANGAGPTLQTRFGFFHDRHDNGPQVIGIDADVANIIKTDIHTICLVRADDCHEQEMTVGNLSPNVDVYLQFFGGDAGWNGQLEMFVNGESQGTWTSNTDNPSTFGFTTTTDAAGELNIDMNIVAGTNFSGVSAFFVVEGSNIPEPSTFLLAALGLLGLSGCGRRRRAA